MVHAINTFWGNYGSYITMASMVLLTLLRMLSPFQHWKLNRTDVTMQIVFAVIRGVILSVTSFIGWLIVITTKPSLEHFQMLACGCFLPLLLYVFINNSTILEDTMNAIENGRTVEIVKTKFDTILWDMLMFILLVSSVTTVKGEVPLMFDIILYYVTIPLIWFVVQKHFKTSIVMPYPRYEMMQSLLFGYILFFHFIPVVGEGVAHRKEIDYLHFRFMR